MSRLDSFIRRLEAQRACLDLAAHLVRELKGDVPRNATVRAKDRVIVLRISKEPFMRMVREFPNMAVSIMRELAQRVDLTNHQLSAAHAEVKRLREQAGIAA